MKKIGIGTIYVILFSIIYVVVLVVLLINGRIKPDELSKLLLSLGAGLIGWLITHFITNLLNRQKEDDLKKIETSFREYLESKFPPHSKETNRVLNHIVCKNSITVMATQRKNIDYDNLNNLFITARLIKISGIACKDLIEDLCKNNEHAFLETLRHNEGVRVDILINDPDAEHIKYRDLFESRNQVNQNPCSTGIRDSIGNIEKLGIKLKDISSFKPAKRSILQIRKTRVPLSNTLNYVQYYESKESTDLKEKMLIGFLFTHIEGYNSLMYEVSNVDKTNMPNEHFQYALQSFIKIFDDIDSPSSPTSSLLKWDCSGVEMNVAHVKP